MRLLTGILLLVVGLGILAVGGYSFWVCFVRPSEDLPQARDLRVENARRRLDLNRKVLAAMEKIQSVPFEDPRPVTEQIAKLRKALDEMNKLKGELDEQARSASEEERPKIQEERAALKEQYESLSQELGELKAKADASLERHDEVVQVRGELEGYETELAELDAEEGREIQDSALWWRLRWAFRGTIALVLGVGVCAAGLERVRNPRRALSVGGTGSGTSQSPG